MTDLSKKQIKAIRGVIREWDAGKSDPTYTGNRMADLLEEVVIAYHPDYIR